MSTTDLYLVRHGEAVVNVKPIVGGMRGDTGLTDYGVQQAEALRERLASGDIPVDVLIASTLPRARQTAEIIAPALKRSILFDDEVQEMRVGEADGMANQDAWARYGMPMIDKDAFHRISPGGENWSEFMLRVGTALHRIAREHQGQKVMVVCHGGVIDGAFFYFLGMNILAPPQTGFYTINTSITHWRHSTRDTFPRWRLMRYNDTMHLRNVGAKESIDWKSTAAMGEPDNRPPSLPMPTEEPDTP